MNKIERRFKKTGILFLLIICIITSKNISAQAAGFATPGVDNTPNPIYVHTAGASPTGVYIGRGNGTGNAHSTAVGILALSSVTNGQDNTAVGQQSQSLNKTGSANSAFGNFTLTNNLFGNFNSAFGASALNALNGAAGSSDSNTAVGSTALFQFTNGSGNIALGEGALGTFLTGNNNVGIGHRVSLPNGSNYQLTIQDAIYGINMRTGNVCNVGIGVIPSGTLAKLEVGGTLKINVVNVGTPTLNRFLFRDPADNILKEAAIPSQGITSSCSTQYYVPRVNATGSANLTCSQIYDNGNSVGIGTTTNLSYTSISGQWLHGTGAPGTFTPTPASGPFRLSVEGVTRSLAYFAYSDKRLKRDIEPLKNMLSIIKKLNGVAYNWDKSNRRAKEFSAMHQVGFIAQDIAKVVPEAVVIDEEGYYSMNYSTIIPILNEGIKEQQTQIETQQLKIENLELQIAELKNKLNQLTPGDVKIKLNSLEVAPNPVTGISVVSYKLENSNAPSFLVISDLQGKILKQISLAKNQQQGQVQVSKSDLPGGMYVFAIISGNTEIQSKKVLVSATE